MKKVKFLCVFVLTIVIICASCQKGEEKETIKIAGIKEQIDELDIEEAEMQEEAANKYLREKEKNYRIDFQMISKSSFENAEALDSYDIVYSFEFDYSTQELSHLFLDLSGELQQGGELQPLYESMPDTYWETLKINDSIYSTVRFNPVVRSAIIIDKSAMESLGLSLPNHTGAKSLKEWKEYFEAIFEANGGKPFLVNPFITGREDIEITPFMKGFSWFDHFQLVAPHLGISYEEPELGVQCIYESSYAREVLDIWNEYAEKQYVLCYSLEEYQTLFEMELKDIVPMVTIGWSYQNEVTEIENGIYAYPLQDTCYAIPQYAAIESGSLYQVLVPKNAPHLYTTFQFMNDMATDVELSKVICERAVESEYDYSWCVLTPAAGSIDGVGTRRFYDDPVEGLKNLERSYGSLKQTPASGFVFDTSSLQDTIEAIKATVDPKTQNPFAELAYGELGFQGWLQNEEKIQEYIDELYNAGLQTLIDAANEQLKNYHS